MKTKTPQQTSEKTEAPDLMIRAATVDIRAAEGDAPAQVRMSVSSDAPVLTTVYVNDKWQRAYEILDSRPAALT
jgi:hypothetical protein